jgi:protein-disulfide isomerase
MGKDRVETGRRGRAGAVTPRGRRNRPMNRFYMALAGVAVAGAAVIGYVATRPKQEALATIVDPNLSREAQGYLRGDSTAPVQILEWADYECPACAQFATITEPDVRKRLIETGQASYRFFDFPLEQHRNSVAASMAAACADDQKKYWEMHDLLFAGQDQWNTLATSNPKRVFEGYAKQAGLNMAAWESCFDGNKYARRIQANRAEGERRQVRSTPTFVVGSRMLPGALAYDRIKALVDSAAASKTAPTPAPAAGN